MSSDLGEVGENALWLCRVSREGRCVGVESGGEVGECMSVRSRPGLSSGKVLSERVSEPEEHFTGWQ